MKKIKSKLKLWLEISDRATIWSTAEECARIADYVAHDLMSDPYGSPIEQIYASQGALLVAKRIRQHFGVAGSK